MSYIYRIGGIPALPFFPHFLCFRLITCKFIPWSYKSMWSNEIPWFILSVIFFPHFARFLLRTSRLLYKVYPIIELGLSFDFHLLAYENRKSENLRKNNFQKWHTDHWITFRAKSLSHRYLCIVTCNERKFSFILGSTSDTLISGFSLPIII